MMAKNLMWLVVNDFAFALLRGLAFLTILFDVANKYDAQGINNQGEIVSIVWTLT